MLQHVSPSKCLFVHMPVYLYVCVCVFTDAQEGVTVYVSVCLSHFLRVEIRGRRRAELSDSWK